jgi:hypothetical protein
MILILIALIIGFNQISALFTWQVGLIAESERRDSIYNSKLTVFAWLCSRSLLKEHQILLKQLIYECLHCLEKLYHVFPLQAAITQLRQFESNRQNSIIFMPQCFLFLSNRICFANSICRTQSARCRQSAYNRYECALSLHLVKAMLQHRCFEVLLMSAFNLKLFRCLC